VLLAALLGLSACGPLPQPFRGQPGEEAERLARPPAFRVAIPPPGVVMLPDAEAALFAGALAEALAAEDIPAIAGEPWPLDWRVEVGGELVGRALRPRYVLRDADGAELGVIPGQPLEIAVWAVADAALLGRVAGEVGPALASLVARVDAGRRTGDEAATGARPLLLYVVPVLGAPGDGNRSLAARMRERLAGLGLVVLDQAEGAQYAVQGQVSVVPAARGQQRVEIVWIVTRRDGFELGRVLQLNNVPAGTLDRLWGDVAFVVADEASGGVRDVIANAGGFAPAEQGPAALWPPGAGGPVVAERPRRGAAALAARDRAGRPVAGAAPGGRDRPRQAEVPRATRPAEAARPDPDPARPGLAGAGRRELAAAARQGRSGTARPVLAEPAREGRAEALRRGQAEAKLRSRDTPDRPAAERPRLAGAARPREAPAESRPRRRAGDTTTERPAEPRPPERAAPPPAVTPVAAEAPARPLRLAVPARP
jgi:hypothetical protein